MIATSLPRRDVFAALSVVLATLSLVGLRGIAGFYVSPAIAFALSVVAVGAALRRSHHGREPTTTSEIALALAIAAGGAAVVAILATGHI